MANHFSIRALRTPWKIWKDQNRTLKDELPWLVGAQYTTGDQWRNNNKQIEETKPKQKLHIVVDVTGNRSKVRLCKEQFA